MAAFDTPRPTERELEILFVLWEQGSSTVREIHEVLIKQRKTAYTSALTILQIMTEKGLVLRDESQRSHIYQAAETEEKTQEQFVEDIVQRVFHGSAMTLVTRALSAKAASKDELAQIRDLLKQMEDEE